MAYRIPQSSAFTVPFWLVTSDGTTPDTGASNDSIVLYAGGSNASFVPDVLVTAVHAAAGQYKVVLSTSNTSQLGALWGYHAQGSFQMPIFAAYVEAGSVSTFAASTDSVGLKGVNHPGATIPTVTTLTGHTAQTGDAFARLGAPAGASVSADVAAVKVDTAAILVDTGTTLDAKIDAIDDLLDTEVAAIKTVVDAIEVDTQDIQSRIPAALTGGGNMKSDMLAISGDTAAADALEALMDGTIVAQVNDAGATTTAFIADGFTEATNDHFNGRLITFISGALSGQQTAITDYVGATQTFTVDALTEAPANNDFFVIH
jgi:hypothetical protein